MIHSHATQCQARGFVLFVAMMVLLVLSLLGMAIANSAILENRMAAGTRNLQLARLAADSALEEGRAQITRAVADYGVAQVCAHLTCVARDTSAPADPAEFMQTAPALAASISFHVDLAALDGADRSARLQKNAVYVLEDIGTTPATPDEPGAKGMHWFRVSAGATGGSGGFTQSVERTFALPQE